MTQTSKQTIIPNNTKKGHKTAWGFFYFQYKISKILHVFSSQPDVSNQCAMECVGHRCQTAELTILV